MHFFFLVTVLVYLAASIFQALYLTIGERSETPTLRPRIALIAYWATCLGFGLLTLFIILWWSRQGHFPMTHWTDSTAFFAWANTLVYLIVVRLTQLRAIGSFVIPTAFVAILISYSFSGNEATLPENLKTYWLVPHVTLILLAYAAFITAFGFGVLYLMAEKKIRQKAHTLFHNLLPALGASDELGHRCTILGVILLTIGVIVGALWTQYIQEITWRWLDAKVFLTVVTWVIYVVQIGIRQLWGWRGRKAAYSEIVGFVAVLCTYIGVNLFLDSTHTFR
ncbi:MAG: cytochrome c biogenesis protein CcsA [Candidatus Poribacteria bacterium]|nr:cytochrome c biogenesis protein CcsA [Candidatus Poribacteria bacterium]